MNRLLSVFFITGAILLLLGAVVYVTHWTYAPYIYTVGATLVALAQVNTPYKGTNRNIRRLRRQQLFGAFLLVVSGGFMMLTDKNEWILCLSVAALLQLHTAFRIPQEEKKEKEG
ncbi:MAG: hypothetical protein LIP08_07760 [Bacteroides sp.]|nr:hypothetical protein [Bacteroides sp.]